MVTARKSDHIHINLTEDVNSGITTGLEQYFYVHEALPEINFNDIDLSQTLFGKKIHSPILISSMTGGTPEALKINQILAEAAQQEGIAMGVGSQRAALEHPEVAYTFQVRKYAPSILLLANVGAIQLNYGYTIDHCRRAVEMIEADALILHLNPLQEAVQPEGDTDFFGLLRKIQQVCKAINLPVIAKEVGNGISETTAKYLLESGIAAIDVAGAGGTSWSQVEMYRIKDPHLANVAAAFRDWGIPTSESILNVKKVNPQAIIFASGGLRSGVDIAKCITLGASLGGIARPFLKAAVNSLEDTIETIGEIKKEIQICMFLTSSPNLSELRKAKLVKRQVFHDH